MNDRDKCLIEKIKKHYRELKQNLVEMNDSYEKFITTEEPIVKAIDFDLFQIGELISKLSDESSKHIDHRNLVGIVAIRNRIVHGYETINNDIIWDSIHKDLPKLIEQINSIK